jgi:hypothetical protein
LKWLESVNPNSAFPCSHIDIQEDRRNDARIGPSRQADYAPAVGFSTASGEKGVRNV